MEDFAQELNDFILEFEEHGLRRARRILESVTARTARGSKDESGGEMKRVHMCAVEDGVVSRLGAERERGEYKGIGMELVRDGRVAIVLLAGGQGTRLGSDAPKGCYDIGLPSRKSLFQLQCERVLRLQKIAGSDDGSSSMPLPLYVMTSPFTHRDTMRFFAKHDNFGLDKSQISFFQQQTLPCLTDDGEPIIFLGGKGEKIMARAPDGNGGVYEALVMSGCIDDMERRGVACVDCFCVDNALILPAEPTWIGYVRDDVHHPSSFILDAFVCERDAHQRSCRVSSVSTTTTK